MEQQSTSATPSKRQDYVQYTPQVVTNYNQQFDQQGGLGSPSQEHYEDSMLELKDVDTLPSNYAFLSHQIPNNNNTMMPPPQQQQPVIMMPLSQQQPVMYLPPETQQRVYETPSNNNYIHSGMINPNVPSHHMMMMPSPSSEPLQDTSKYTTWTRVVLVFAVILGIYGCFVFVSQLLSVFSFANFNTSKSNTMTSIPSIIFGFILSITEILASAIGVWSTVTKNQKHRKYATIAHLTLLSLVVVIHIASAVFVNLQIMNDPTIFAATGVNPQNLTFVIILSILFYILMIFACCGSCIGCQAYRFRIMTKLQDTQSDNAQGEGFMVMRDEV